MDEYYFGLGEGHLPRRADTIARRHDASLCNHTDAECRCGYGCRPFTCPRARRHWFATRHLGSPFDDRTALAVLADLRAEGVIPE